MAVKAQEAEQFINIECNQQCGCHGQQAKRHHSDELDVAKIEDETLSKSGSQA
jgi:hypothetical protein